MKSKNSSKEDDNSNLHKLLNGEEEEKIDID
jgi:hypothetical protein